MNSPLAALELYSRSDADLIAHAEAIIGDNRLRLSLAEAVAIIRSHYNAN